MDLNEALARAMCVRDGWVDADQTAHHQDGPDGPVRVRRWQVYLKRVELARLAFADAGLTVLPGLPDAEAWRAAVADAEPDHPLGSFENRELAYRFARIFAALVANVARDGQPADQATDTSPEPDPV